MQYDWLTCPGCGATIPVDDHRADCPASALVERLRAGRLVLDEAGRPQMAMQIYPMEGIIEFARHAPGRALTSLILTLAFDAVFGDAAYTVVSVPVTRTAPDGLFVEIAIVATRTDSIPALEVTDDHPY